MALLFFDLTLYFKTKYRHILRTRMKADHFSPEDPLVTLLRLFELECLEVFEVSVRLMRAIYHKLLNP